MKTHFFRKARATTLTELLVVVAIISLLATIAVPVYLNQIQRARVSTARAEVREIANAMQNVAVTHGFMVPIHVLDNIPNRGQGNNLGGSSSDRDDFEQLDAQSSFSQTFLIDVSRPLDLQDGGEQLNLNDRDQDFRVDALIEGWAGPFLNPSRVRFVGEDPTVPGTGNITEDLVIDPWGNPYRVYSDFGLMGASPLPSSTNEDVFLEMDTLELNSGSPEQDRFDRFAILSYGPDGITGFDGSNPLDQGDDIFYTFSVITPNETQFRGF